ncbi:hypothetical protein DL93DRAFT_2047216, partial [Clavulina sp. PMI_390]
YIYIFTDNTGAIQRIFEGTPGLAQRCSLQFRNNMLKVLDDHPQLRLTIEWVPGHHDIKGNDKADRLAKDGCDLAPTTPGWPSIALSRETGSITGWPQNGAPGPTSLRQTNFRPQLTPTFRLRNYNCTTFSRLNQMWTGHAHTGSHYGRFVPSEPTECPCGHYLQTRQHILQDCPDCDRFRHLLGEDEEDRSMEELLGTRKGVARLAEFIEVTDAFAK